MRVRCKSAVFFLVFVLLCILLLPQYSVIGCKDIVAVHPATRGEYNLLLKVRDPSRPGIQVLCMVPHGYSYSYHHPWSGKVMDFTVQKKYFGIATKNDTIPNSVKTGMMLSSSGIAYGDADTNSYWCNPTRNAWDDFDWLRYACQKASTEEEAVQLLTKDVVDTLHAPGVSENLFVVGPQKAYVIEADAFRYSVNEIKDVLVRSNYPVDLWKTQRNNRPIAASFDSYKEVLVRPGSTIHLGSRFGVRIIDVGENYITVRQTPAFKISNRMIRWMGEPVRISMNERKTVGDFSVTLKEYVGRQARIHIEYVFSAWENKMFEYIEPKIGDITIQDMMNWSRLHADDLDDLRPMCEDSFQYVASMIFKIPQKEYSWLSSGWFAANHACSSIYVPIHICDTSIYPAFTSGDAADTAFKILEIYGHDTTTPWFENIEEVFLVEMQYYEDMAQTRFFDESTRAQFLTLVDMMMQEQAYQTMKLWTQYPAEELFLGSLWMNNFSQSLTRMSQHVHSLYNNQSFLDLQKDIVNMALLLCRSHIDIAGCFEKNISAIEEQFEKGKKLIEEKNFTTGFENLQKSLIKCYQLFQDDSVSSTLNIDILDNQDKTKTDKINLFLGIVLVVFIISLILRKNDIDLY